MGVPTLVILGLSVHGFFRFLDVSGLGVKRFLLYT